MNRSVTWMIVSGLLNVGVVLLIAPFFQGVLRKITARIQSRQGPPLAQPYFDLLKLLGKEDIESGESPLMQRFAVYLALAAVLLAAPAQSALPGPTPPTLPEPPVRSDPPARSELPELPATAEAPVLPRQREPLSSAGTEVN